MKLVTKITVSLAVATLGMLIISISSYLGFTKIDKELTQISDYQVAMNKLVVNLQKEILEEKSHIYELLYVSTKNSKESFLSLKNEVREISTSTKSVIKDTEVLVQKALIFNEDKYIKKSYKDFLDELNKLKEVHTIFYDELSSLNIENFHLEKKSLLEKMDFMTKEIDRLNTQVDDFLKTTTLQAEKNEENALFRMGFITFISLLLSIVTSISLMRLVRQKFHDFEHGFNIFFEFLNRKREDIKLLDDSSRDEFGLMSKIINENIKITKDSIEEDKKVIDETVKVLTEFEQGDLYQRVDIQSSNPALKELTTLLNKMAEHLEHNIEAVIDVLDQYSNYNYLKRVNSSGLKFHLLKLANGINAIGDSTTQMLQKSKITGLTLDLTSDILLENVDILNKNSNEAAAALEETAAALEQMTGTINQNSENIKQMVSNANELRKSSNTGKELAHKTTQSMVDIDEQVNAINDAIVVIDQIAFQTNILSLNAAVEAATAGEAGKGFAVVAQEVRNLASRSAQAAKEIKDLVESATNKANEGKDIAQDMIDGYTNLNENILQTLELIKGVEAASSEQQSGIKQINDAVTNLDHETQENVMIFAKTKEVAVQTDVMAKESVSDVDSKEFESKNDLKARDLSQIKSSYTQNSIELTQWENF